MRKRARSEYGDRYWMIANYLSIKKRFSIPTSCSLSVILRSSITLNKKKIGRLVLCLYYSKWRRWYIHNHNNSTSNILLYQAMCNELKVTYRFTCQFRSFSNKFDQVYKITKFIIYLICFTGGILWASVESFPCHSSKLTQKQITMHSSPKAPWVEIMFLLNIFIIFSQSFRYTIIVTESFFEQT